MTHERTPLGRELLCLQRDIRTWVALNSGREPSGTIEAAERLACEISAAAWNGLGIAKESLRAAVNNELLLRRQSTNAR